MCHQLSSVPRTFGQHCSCKIAIVEEEVLVAKHFVVNAWDRISRSFKACRQLVNFWEDVKL